MTYITLLIRVSVLDDPPMGGRMLPRTMRFLEGAQTNLLNGHRRLTRWGIMSFPRTFEGPRRS